MCLDQRTGNVANGYGVNLIHTKGTLVVAGDRGRLPAFAPLWAIYVMICSPQSKPGMSGKISSGMADEEELTAGEWWIQVEFALASEGRALVVQGKGSHMHESDIINRLENDSVSPESRLGRPIWWSDIRSGVKVPHIVMFHGLQMWAIFTVQKKHTQIISGLCVLGCKSRGNLMGGITSTHVLQHIIECI